MPLAITESADLSALNAFGIAARARRLITLTDEADAPEAIDLLQSAPRSLLLGAGSNLLFTRDVDGTVLKVSLSGRKVADAALEGVGDYRTCPACREFPITKTHCDLLGE